MDIDWAHDTADFGDHMNFAGAQKVSSYIADYLADTYDLPDHREDAAYSDWNDVVEWYQDRFY